MAKTKKRTKKQKHIIRKILILIVVIAVLFLVLCFISPTEAEVESTITSSGKIENLEIPSRVDGDQIIKHTGYTLSYNEEYEVANWVAYELTREEVLGSGTREDSFKADPSVKTGSATLDDYKKSGYDRGHLAPAADFKWSEDAMSDTFFLSNMTPQDPSFNRGIWSDLEAVVRTMAYDNGSVYVVTGPVLTDGPYKTIGKNKVAVPKQFYKVILDYTDPDIKAIGFVLPNEASDSSLQSFATTVDEVEAITGIDFYPLLPDDIEEKIESSADPSKWSFRIFMPTGESADIEYVAPTNTRSEEIISIIMDALYEIKKSVFEYTGTTKIAREIGLI